MQEKKPKFLQILLSLDSNQISELKKYLVAYDFFGHPKTLSSYLKILLKAKNPTTYFSDSNAQKKLIKQLKIADSTIKNLNTSFYKSILNFLAFYQLKKDNQQKKILTIEALNNTNYAYFKSETIALINEIKSSETNLEVRDYLRLHQLENKLWFHPKTNHFKADAALFEDSLIHLNNALELSTLYYACLINNRTSIFSDNSKRLLNEAFLNTIKKKDFDSENPLFGIFQQILMLQEKHDIKEFQQLTDLIQSQYASINQDTFLNLNLFMISYGNKLVKNGNYQLNAQLLKIYQYLLDKKLLPVDNHFRDNEFIGIYLLGCYNQQFEWLDQFVANYQQFLEQDAVQEIINYLLAYKYFYQKDYQKIKTYLDSFKPDNRVFYYFRIKGLYIRYLYETWQPPHSETLFELEDYCKKFENGFKNKSMKIIAPSTKKSCLNFIKMLKRLIRFRKNLSASPKRLESIKTSLVNTDNILYKPWLIQKVKEL